MSFQQDPITILAGENLEPYRRVLFNGTNWMLADKNEEHHGITMQYIASGARGAAHVAGMPGVVGIESATTLTAGNTCYAADDGKVSSTVDGLRVGLVFTAPLAASNPAGIIQRPVVKRTVSYTFPATPVDAAFFIAPVAMRVRSVNFRPLATAAGATAVIKKAPSATAVSGGTALHSNNLTLDGTTNVNQAGTLSATSTDLLLAAGDCVGIDVSGTTTNATGVVTLELEDQ